MRKRCSIQQGEKRSLLIRAKSWKIDCIDCSVFVGPPGIGTALPRCQVDGVDPYRCTTTLKFSTCSVRLMWWICFPFKGSISHLYGQLRFMSYPRDGKFSTESACVCKQKGKRNHAQRCMASVFTVRLRLEWNRTTDPLFRRRTAYPLRHTCLPLHWTIITSPLFMLKVWGGSHCPPYTLSIGKKGWSKNRLQLVIPKVRILRRLVIPMVRYSEGSIVRKWNKVR